MNDLNNRERATIVILLFIIKLLKPTGYDHEVTKLRDDLNAQLDGEKDKAKS